MSLTLEVGAPFLIGSWPPDLQQALREAAELVAVENRAALGTGAGGAGNSLADLSPVTVAKKGHGRVLEETQAMGASMRVISERDQATFAISPGIFEPADEFRRDQSTPKSTAEVASILISGRPAAGDRPSKLPARPFIGARQSTMAKAVERVELAAAGALGGIVESPRASQGAKRVIDRAGVETEYP